MLDRNPIAWLQQYSWKARASKWGLAVLVLVVAGAAFKVAGSGNFQNLMTTYGWLHFLFVVMYALAGVSGFWREKQSGALELILITPLSVNSIILGRTFGLWKQFLPAAVSLVVFHAAALVSDPDSISFERTVLPGWIAICSFFSLPVFATYAALRAGNMVMAGFLTCLGTMLGGMLGMELASFVSIILDLQESTLLLFLALVSISVGYASFVGLTFFLLRHSLSRRIYSF